MQAVEYGSEQLRFSVYNKIKTHKYKQQYHFTLSLVLLKKMNCDTNCNFSSNLFSSNTSKYASMQADMSAVCVCLSITHTNIYMYPYTETPSPHLNLREGQKGTREKKIQRTTITSLFNQGGQSVFPH